MKSVEITYRYVPNEGALPRRPVDAEAARRRLEDGSRAFAELFTRLDAGDGTARRIIPIHPRDLGLLPEGEHSLVQRPYAAVLGCADARVPIELIFNEGPNDLFVVRVAGNTLGDDVRGSLRYAIEHLGESLRLIVVLGHSGCGAVTAAVDVFLAPTGYLSLVSKHTIRTLIDRLQVVVQAAARRLEAAFGADIVGHPGYREALIEASVVFNAALAAHTLQQEIGLEAADGVRTAYGVYLLEERTVWAPRHGSAEVTGLAAPPDGAEEFLEFSHAVVDSPRIARLLAPAKGASPA
jgi:carbonic anhydrase